MSMVNRMSKLGTSFSDTSSQVHSTADGHETVCRQAVHHNKIIAVQDVPTNIFDSA